jgi:hypothetical protein
MLYVLQLVLTLQGYIELYFLQDHGVFPKNTIVQESISTYLQQVTLRLPQRNTMCMNQSSSSVS